MLLTISYFFLQPSPTAVMLIDHYFKFIFRVSNLDGINFFPCRKLLSVDWFVEQNKSTNLLAFLDISHRNKNFLILLTVYVWVNLVPSDKHKIGNICQNLITLKTK